MRSWRLAVVFFASLAACQFDPKVSSSPTVRCDDGRCPAGMTCRTRLGLCVQNDVDPGTPVTVLNGRVTPARVKSGDALRVTFSVSRELLATPTVTIFESSGAHPLMLESNSGLDYVFTYTVNSAIDGEGLARIAADLVDDSGNETVNQALGTSELDFTPPSLIPESRALTLRPPAGCSLSSVSALGLAGGARLEFSLNEPGTVTLASRPVGLSFTQGTSSGSQFSFSATATSMTPQGALGIDVVVTDSVGNSATLDFGQSVTVDTVTPASPDALSNTAITYQRTPWGSRDGGADYRVVGVSGAASVDTVVQVLDNDDVIGSGAATDAGFNVAFRGVDRVSVGVRSIDNACNTSPTVDVKNVEWLATLKGKVPGRTFENPHSVEGRLSSAFLTTQSGSVEVTPRVGLSQEGGNGWVSHGDSPLAMNLHALAFDSGRNKVVLFGGSTGSATSLAVWEWDGASATWTNRTPSPLPLSWPSARTQHALAFDSKRNKVVLFGGISNGKLNDIWEWDGASGTWANKTPSPLPPSWPAARNAHALAFDSGRNKVVLFGGINNDEVWEWDGTSATWANKTPSPRPPDWPPETSDHALTFDAARNKVVLFGGVANGLSDEVWEWDGQSATWANKTPSSRPPLWPAGRRDHRMAFDSARNKVVLFGGASSTPLLSDVWEWDGASATWANKTPTPRPQSWPAARNNHALTFDSARNKVVLFGGLGNGYRNDIWEWDGPSATWANKTPSPQTALFRPSPRNGHALAFDSVRNKVVLFGGQLSSGPQVNEVWEWDGASATWSNKTPSPLPPSWPSARYSHGFTFDSARNKAVLFGGLSTPFLNDVWEWDGESATWTNKTPSPLPPSWPTPRSGVTLVYDSTRNKVVLYGGTANPYPNDVWEWDGAMATWENKTPSPLPLSWPPMRRNHALAFDSARNKVVLFGGQLSAKLNDLWEWDGASATWTNKTPSPLPPAWPSAREDHALVFNSARNRVLLFGGQSVGPTNDVWEWDGVSATWADNTPSPLPPSWPSTRFRPALAFDSARNRVLLFGGSTSYLEPWTYSGDYGGDVDARPGLVSKFSFSLAGAEPGATLTSATITTIAGASSGATGVPGVRLLTSVSDVLQIEATSTASDTSPGEMVWQTSSPSRLATLFEGPERRVSVGVTPTGFNASGRVAIVRQDWVELLVRYRRP